MDWTDLLLAVVTREWPGTWLACSPPASIDSRTVTGAESPERLSRLLNVVPRLVEATKFEPSGNFADRVYLDLVPPPTAGASGIKPMPAGDIAALDAAAQSAQLKVGNCLRDSLIVPGIEWLLTTSNPPSFSEMRIETVRVPVANTVGQTIAAQVGSMTVDRPWFDISLLARQDWYWAGHRKWEIAGPIDTRPGYLQAICVSAVMLWAAYLEEGTTRQVLQEPGWSLLAYEVLALPPSPPNDDPSFASIARSVAKQRPSDERA